MKKIFSFLIFIAPVVVAAQVNIDRSKAPKPAPAPVIQIADPASFTLPNGLKVFVVTNTKLPRVSASLTIDRDPVLEGEKAGLVSLAGELMRRGTTKMNKAELDEAVDFLGADLSASSSSVYAASLKSNFPKVMELLADVVLRPAFPVEELEKIRKQTLTGLQAAKDNPNSISTNVVNKLMYGADHPYGEIETEETVKRVTIDDVKNYYNTYWKPNIGYLVFVGDITAGEAKQLTEKYFAGWQKAEVPEKIYAAPKPPAKTYIALVDRPASVQSVIKLVTPIDLKPGSPNAIAASVMSNILGGSSTGRLYKNLRETKGFTYGAYGGVNPDRYAASFSASASVRNEKTDSAVHEFLVELNKLRSEPVTEEELSMVKNLLSGSFARSLEHPSTIAQFALNIARYNLPKDYYRNYLTNLAKVTTADVSNVAKAYVLPENLHIVIVGNAKQIAKGLEKYGDVRYFDVYGNPIAAPVEKKIDALVTAESILKKSIQAIGGDAAIAAINDIILNGSASLMGEEATITQKVIIPNGYSFELSIQGMTLQKELLKNGEYSTAAQGKEVPADDKMKEELNEKAAFFQDVYMLKNRYTFSLKGIESVEGSDAYALEIKTPQGRTFTKFYDDKSGLPVKSSIAIETPKGPFTVSIYFQNYKDFNGVKIPTKVINDLGQFKIEANFNDVKVNTGLKADDLK